MNFHSSLPLHLGGGQTTKGIQMWTKNNGFSPQSLRPLGPPDTITCPETSILGLFFGKNYISLGVLFLPVILSHILSVPHPNRPSKVTHPPSTTLSHQPQTSLKGVPKVPIGWTSPIEGMIAL